MTKRMTAVLIMAAFVLGVSAARAHDTFRVIGTLTKHQDWVIDVKNANGRTISIALDQQTVITRDKKKVSATDLKVGQSVVVDAYGDTEADLLALQIQIVPPIAAR